MPVINQDSQLSSMCDQTRNVFTSIVWTALILHGPILHCRKENLPDTLIPVLFSLWEALMKTELRTEERKKLSRIRKT